MLEKSDCVTVWFAMKPTSTFLLHVFLFFFFQSAIVDFVNCEQCICVLFTVPQITLFSNFFIKNGSHNTIYPFKNYFVTVFSVSVFSFSKNKFNPNTPYIWVLKKSKLLSNKITKYSRIIWELLVTKCTIYIYIYIYNFHCAFNETII